MKSKTPHLLITIVQWLAGAIALSLLTYAVVQYLERPIVYKSWTTKQCVRVEVAPKHKALTCEEALANGSYTLEWVK